MRKQLCLCVLGSLLCATPIWAQDSERSANPDDPMSRPTEYGLRTTPGLIRALTKLIPGAVFGDPSSLNEEQRNQISELIARRIMEAAHKMDGPGQELVERFIEEQIKFADAGGRAFIPPSFGQEFAEKLQPLLPAIRDMFNHIAGDVRPMLPMKQQLTLAGEMMAFNTAFDGFEYTMDQWAQGNVPNTGDPFNQGQVSDPGIEKKARERAESVLEKGRSEKWEQYVQDAKDYYELDESQSATADSILRELLQRADLIASDETWQHRVYCNRLWQYLEIRLLRRSNHPFRVLNNKNYEELMKPISVLEEELKHRIDTIPTRAQRQAAEELILKRLARHLGEEAAPIPQVNEEESANTELSQDERDKLESLGYVTKNEDQPEK